MPDYKLFLQQLHTQISAVLAAEDPPTDTRLPEMWFAPSPKTADYRDLFTHPDLWATARSRMTGFAVYDLELVDKPLLGQLITAKAFSRLTELGLYIIQGGGVLRSWQCKGEVMANTIALPLLQIITTEGGQVKYLSFDEPGYHSTIGHLGNCGYTFDQAAQEVANYVRVIHAEFPHLLLADAEPYPAFRLHQLKQWLTALKQHGVQVSVFHLDVDMATVHRWEAEGRLNFAADWRELMAFCTTEGIQFGTFLLANADWNETTDKGFYDGTLRWIRMLKDSLGIPSNVVFTSAWREDKAVPSIILPEITVWHSLTRLLNDGLAAFMA